MRCYAYSFPRAFAVAKIREYIEEKYTTTILDGVYHIRYKHPDILINEGDIFIFPYGAMVTWGLTEELERKFIIECNAFLADLKLGSVDDDVFTYTYAEKSSVKDDLISLPNNEITTKLACSYGLAQSAKLGGFESTLSDIFSRTSLLPEQLADEGNIHLSRKQIRKLMGKLFVDRASINLHLDFLDAPNFFWNHTGLEHLHEMVGRYVDLDKRVNVLNQRLRIMQEMLDILTAELNHQHSSMLELIIIILIATEIGLMIFKEFSGMW